MSLNQINRTIDHTLLKPEATSSQVESLCHEAIKYHFYSVCINPQYVSLAAKILKNTGVEVCTVIGFPLGANTSQTKAFETKNAISNGATEIDMVVNIGAIKSDNYQLVESDIKAVVDAAGSVPVKVILETCLLTNEEIQKACECARRANALFVKTSTGFSTSGASVEAVKLMKASIPNFMKVKASGGIRDLESAQTYLALGVERLGTSSGVAIMEKTKSSSDY